MAEKQEKNGLKTPNEVNTKQFPHFTLLIF